MNAGDGPPSWLARVVFAHFSPVIRAAGKNGRLDVPDMREASPDLANDVLYESFQDAWAGLRERGTMGLVRALIARRRTTILLTGIAYVIVHACSLAGPFLLERIVFGLECRERREDISSCTGRNELFALAGSLAIPALVQSLVESNSIFAQERCGLCMRNTLMAAILRKCIKMRAADLNEETLGRVQTLMSIDSQQVHDIMMMIHSIWGSPIYIVAIMWLLYREIQWAALVGLAVMLIITPASGVVIRKMKKLREHIRSQTEQRTNIMSELLAGIKVIKSHAWEGEFSDKVAEVRATEAKGLRELAKVDGIFQLTVFAGPILVSTVSFAAYAAAGNELTTTKLYTALALFSLLRFPLAFLPAIIAAGVSAAIALKRIANFLKKDEMENEGLEYRRHGTAKGVVKVQRASFAWKAASGTDGGEKGDVPLKAPTSELEVQLHDITFTCRSKCLTMVVGAVASGKSSLLSAILQEMVCLEGRVRVGGSVAYVPQTAWILNTTVQQNILMGAPMDKGRYQEALRCAQLVDDLDDRDMFPHGDQTLIGERGITLSGGQKQRVSIARAVYANADVVLMDDPLSALDAQVSRAVFEDCILNTLRHKTVILVTNALHLVHHAKQVIWMHQGRALVGSYREVSEHQAFGALLSRHVVMDDESAPQSQQIRGRQGKGPAIQMQRPGGCQQEEEQEHRSAGAVAARVRNEYATAMGGWPFTFMVGFLFVLEQALKIATDGWLGLFTEEPPIFQRGLGFWLGLHAAWAAGFALVTCLRSITFMLGAARASVVIHGRLLATLMRLPLRFFETNPDGRIINRFSKDTDIMDSILPAAIMQLLACLATVGATLVVISYSVPLFIPVAVVLMFIYYIVQRYYVPAARELQRLENVTRSPIFTHFSEMLAGVTTVRAFNQQSHFTGKGDEMMEVNANVYLTQKAGTAWLGMRLDIIGLVSLSLAGVLLVGAEVPVRFAGLALAYALEMTKFLKYGARMSCKVESDLTSVERMLDYLQEPTEAEVVKQTDPDDDIWPRKGSISVRRASLRYASNLEFVLRGISFEVPAGSRVGIVGRTGSGKSSLFTALLRIVELEAGSILIDNINIADVGLRTLRRRTSLVPQDPFMFSGTLRRNVDPLGHADDLTIWQALERVQMQDYSLDYVVEDNGANFAQGQRQLVCLARALVRKSKILLMDEAMAAIDLETERIISGAIRRATRDNCTVLTIAHRLHSVMDSHAILVMEKGEVAEYASPRTLLEDDSSLLSQLVDVQGAAVAQRLRAVANADPEDALDTFLRSRSTQDSGEYLGTQSPGEGNQDQHVAAATRGVPRPLGPPVRGPIRSSSSAGSSAPGGLSTNPPSSHGGRYVLEMSGRGGLGYPGTGTGTEHTQPQTVSSTRQFEWDDMSRTVTPVTAAMRNRRLQRWAECLCDRMYLMNDQLESQMSSSLVMSGL